MAISDTANNVIGGIGGFVLAACLLPQIYHIYRMRSARDLSYSFIVFFIVGLVLTAIYMIFVEATVGYIAVLCELALAVVMFVSKIYLDNWGPYSRKNVEGGVAKLSIPARARLDMSKFLSGTAGAPFPLLHAETEHTAAHLLLDCQLELNKDHIPSITVHEESSGDSLEGKKSSSALNKLSLRSFRSKSKATTTDSSTLAAAESGQASTSPPKLISLPSMALRRMQVSEFAEMLEDCLEAAELDVYRRQTHAFASFKQRRDVAGAAQENGIAATSDGGNLCFVPVKDGYVTAMWLPESATLAVDFVGASAETISGMNTAAEAFCRKLTEAHPGTRIVASTVSRLPR